MLLVRTLMLTVCLLWAWSLALRIHAFATRRLPGVAWKVPYSQVPELAAIQQAFAKECQVPDLPECMRASTDAVYQAMRDDCLGLPDVEFYEAYEKEETMHRQWLGKFYSQTTDQSYRSRLGAWVRTIPPWLEEFAVQKINELVGRLGLDCRLGRLPDSRGTTYMGPNGFMEYHSNQDHFGGWRLYFHHLPTPGPPSWFAYRHPFDGSYRRIEDSNAGCNMFRIRKPPKDLLWHCIYSPTDRFSWGIWIDPEVARALQPLGLRV